MEAATVEIQRRGGHDRTSIHRLIADLQSNALDRQHHAAAEIRYLTRSNPENRIRIASAGAIPLLIPLLSSPDPLTQEESATALLNLSLRDEIRLDISAAGAIPGLIQVVRTGTLSARENAACALLRLAQVDGQDLAIGRAGGIPTLVELLDRGTAGGKKDACGALYAVCGPAENKARAVRAGVVRVLVRVLGEEGMAGKAAALLGVVAEWASGEVAEEGGVGALVEVLDGGSPFEKEIAVGVLLQLCELRAAHRAAVGREGAVPPLVALSQSGSPKARKKASLTHYPLSFTH